MWAMLVSAHKLRVNERARVRPTGAASTVPRCRSAVPGTSRSRSAAMSSLLREEKVCPSAPTAPCTTALCGEGTDNVSQRLCALTRKGVASCLFSVTLASITARLGRDPVVLLPATAGSRVRTMCISARGHISQSATGHPRAMRTRAFPSMGVRTGGVVPKAPRSVAPVKADALMLRTSKIAGRPRARGAAASALKAAANL